MTGGVAPTAAASTAVGGPRPHLPDVKGVELDPIGQSADVVLALVEVAAAVRVGEVAPGLWAGPGVRVRRRLHLVSEIK